MLTFLITQLHLLGDIILIFICIGIAFYFHNKKITHLKPRQFKFVKELGLNAIYMMIDMYLEKRLDPKDFIERMLRVITVTIHTNSILSKQEKHFLTSEKIREIFYPIILMVMYRVKDENDKELILQGVF
jgi:hypothetical protein